MKRFRPEIIYIHPDVQEHPATTAILKKLKGVETEIMAAPDELPVHNGSFNSRFRKEKRGLILTRKKGDLVKHVQRDLYREIPNEYYIIHSEGCPFDCQYCFLYDYLDHQIPTIFVNIDDILASIESVIRSKPGENVIFHAGEFSDALAYDHITDLSRPFVELFAKYEHATLELRTKSDNVDNLLGLTHAQRTVVSWTFSPQRVAQLYEFHTASTEERIAAARKCQESGYRIGLRLDPIVRYPEWETDYHDLIKSISQKLRPELIADCQIGMFRYTPGLRRIIRDRFPRSYLRLEESVRCQDGKYRYFKPLRLEMYRRILGWLREMIPGLKTELCMESPEVEEALRS